MRWIQKVWNWRWICVLGVNFRKYKFVLNIIIMRRKRFIFKARIILKSRGERTLLHAQNLNVIVGCWLNLLEDLESCHFEVRYLTTKEARANGNLFLHMHAFKRMYSVFWILKNVVFLLYLSFKLWFYCCFLAFVKIKMLYWWQYC